jgi:hypothetical protein
VCSQRRRSIVLDEHHHAFRSGQDAILFTLRPTPVWVALVLCVHCLTSPFDPRMRSFHRLGNTFNLAACSARVFISLFIDKPQSTQKTCMYEPRYQNMQVTCSDLSHIVIDGLFLLHQIETICRPLKSAACSTCIDARW